MGLIEILFSFRLVLEGKIGKEILESSRLEFLKQFLASSFALSDAENNTLVPLNRGGMADLPLLRTLSQKTLRVHCLGSDTLLFYYHMQVWQLDEPFYNNYYDHQDCPNQHENNHKLCTVMVSQWKLRQ